MAAQSLSEFCSFTSLADAIRSACVLEASAAKPGNVHPRASFPDLTFDDFVRSAEAASPVLARAEELGVGRAIFEAIAATRAEVSSNTNLGIVLLIAPLAAVPLGRPLKDGIGEVLDRLTREDAAWVYRAIRLANPGGLGTADEEDVANEPTGTLREVMSLAAHRDGVAAQYANQFEWVLNEGLPFLASIGDAFETCWEPTIIELHLRLMAEHPDTLIARKCGDSVAAEASRRASDCLQQLANLLLDSNQREHSIAEFDRWLRSDGHRRNPGTTADLVAACLFAAIREQAIKGLTR
jgi:triphosphoribosyl-dephospho-CoA synthase